MLCSCQLKIAPKKVAPGAHTSEETPVPIPNTVVKLPVADGTEVARLRESRLVPGVFIKQFTG